MHYIDTSALAKLVTGEAESDALRAFLGDGPTLTSSSLTRIELIRHATRRSPDRLQQARELLEHVDFIGLDPSLLDHAATLEPSTLRTLDAIHVATALLIKDDIEALVTYDRRMQEAAELHGIPFAAPS